MDSRKYRLGYRGDIEGLRAVAIALVVAAHAKVSWLAGGFVGVDVFFVLSGYLITGVLLREIEASGHLGFLNFYARRFRRLLPALLLMIVVAGLCAALLLPPSGQGVQAAAAASAALWLSNFHFAFAHLDYFSEGAASNLFLHTWSLGVEEQFYLIWPALMVWALAARRGKVRNRSRLKLGLFAIAGVSLIACLVLTRAEPQMAFYLMPLRAWQFAAGALVWLYFNHRQDAANRVDEGLAQNPTMRWLGWVGLGLIVASALWFDANMAYPGWRSLLPTVGTAVVIGVGVGGASRGVSRVLAWRPLQALGRLSYSWYLWHWPVLLLGAALANFDSPSYRLVLVVLSLALAYLSYRWVESPIRHQSLWTIRPGKSVIFALTLMVATNVAGIAWFNAASTWQKNPTQLRYGKARTDSPVIYAMGCDDWYHSDTVRMCAFGPKEAKHTVVLMGDSVGAQWFPAVATVFYPLDWRLLVVTKSSCPMVDEPIFYPRIGRYYTECSTWRKKALQQVAELKPDIIILGSGQTADFTATQWVDGTARVLSSISPSAEHVYVLRGTPHLSFNGPSCLASKSWLPWLRSTHGNCQSPVFNKRDDDVYHWLQQASRRFDNVSVLDMNDVVCPNGLCQAEQGDMVVFKDSQHMTATFVESLSPYLAKRLNLEPSAPQPK